MSRLATLSACELRALGLNESKGLVCLYHPDEVALASVLEWLEQPHCHLVTYASDEYPLWLREIPSAPLLLFVQGDVALLQTAQIAMVGTSRTLPEDVHLLHS